MMLTEQTLIKAKKKENTDTIIFSAAGFDTPYFDTPYFDSRVVNSENEM